MKLASFYFPGYQSEFGKFNATTEVLFPLTFIFNFLSHSDIFLVGKNSYWNIELWKSFFTKMLNQYPHDDDRSLLHDLKKSFQDYMASNPQLIKKLKELLSRQRASMCSA